VEDGDDATKQESNNIMLNHDTIGIVVVDAQSDIAVGTSTNGASHKMPG
jgi:N4-(beta-N-acetylglucosaminyl)-L-asparaginase